MCLRERWAEHVTALFNATPIVRYADPLAKTVGTANKVRY